MSIYTYGPWHRWWAWRPVRTWAHGWVWLRTVERRRWAADVCGCPEGWTYRLPA